MASHLKNIVPTPVKLQAVRLYRNVWRDRIVQPMTMLGNNTRMELATRSRAAREKPQLAAARQRDAHLYQAMQNPLVSVTIATYNRAELLVERAVKSALAQTYQNIEILVTGDGCTDDSAERLQALNDPRVHFDNLPRGDYPQDPKKRWMVAGVPPANHNLRRSKGLWIAHLDDDDIWHPKHLETLLQWAYAGDYELVYAQMNRQASPHDWRVMGQPPSHRFWGRHNFAVIPHSTVLFRSYLRLFEFSGMSYRLGAGTDHHVWLRMYHSGVRIGYTPQVTADAPLRPQTTRSDHAAEDRENVNMRASNRP